MSSESESTTSRITVRDVFNRVDEVGRDVSEVKGAVASVRVETTQHATDIKDHESRIRKLEAWRYALPASAILALMGVIGSAVAMALSK